MSRGTSYQFVKTDGADILASLTAAYESITGRTLQPADPDRLFISWVATIIVQERVLQNYTANQNLPSRAEGENLDALGEWIYNIKRPEAQVAVCVVKFNISAPQKSAVIIPKGTRVTDSSRTLVWHTTEDTIITPGEISTEQAVQCETTGSSGNGYLAGQINTLIDIDNIMYFSSCENIVASSGGSEKADDETYYTLMKSSLDAYSTAGPKGAYEYYAKSVSSHILAVKAVQSSPGCVNIYAVMDDGTPADEVTKNAILAACNDDKVRPLTDLVSVEDVETVDYNIDLIYYVSRSAEISLTDIDKSVNAAVDSYIAWQYEKIGRDINPSKLIWLLNNTGIKRADIISPVQTFLKDGSSGGVPQIARINLRSVTNGGYEDE